MYKFRWDHHFISYSSSRKEVACLSSMGSNLSGRPMRSGAPELVHLDLIGVNLLVQLVEYSLLRAADACLCHILLGSL